MLNIMYSCSSLYALKHKIFLTYPFSTTTHILVSVTVDLSFILGTPNTMQESILYGMLFYQMANTKVDTVNENLKKKQIFKNFHLQNKMLGNKGGCRFTTGKEIQIMKQSQSIYTGVLQRYTQAQAPVNSDQHLNSNHEQ